MTKIDIKPIVKQWIDNNLPTQYGEGASWYEAILILTRKLDEVIHQVNNYFDKDLAEIINITLDEWNTSGKLADIINETLFNSKADKTVTDDLQLLKADKIEVEAIGETLTELQDYNDYIEARKSELWVNAKDLGVKGDGITDDTIAIQEALNSFPDKGGTLFFPKGHYVVSSPLIFPTLEAEGYHDHLKLIGIVGVNTHNDGALLHGWAEGQTIFEYTGTTGALFDLRGGTNAEFWSGNTFKNISLYSNYNKSNPSENFTTAIKSYAFVSGVIENISIKFFGNGVDIQAHSYYSRFKEFRIGHCNRGLIASLVNGSTFDKINLSHNVFGAYIVNGGSAINFNGCWIEANDTGVYLKNCANINFKGCWFEGNYSPINIVADQANLISQLTSIGCQYELPMISNRGILTQGTTTGAIKIIFLNNSVYFPAGGGTMFIGGSLTPHVYSIGYVCTPNSLPLASEYAIKLDIGSNLHEDIWPS